jgi:hypothetical protein
MLVWTGIWLAFRRLRSYRKRARAQISPTLRDENYAMSTKG